MDNRSCGLGAIRNWSLTVNKLECPRCCNLIPNNDMPGAYPGALSRLDNKTEICSECGTLEAILDWQGELTDWRTQ